MMHEVLEFLNHNPAVRAFGLSLLHSLWQGFAIAALLWLLIRIAGNVDSRTHYWFASTALGCLLLCFVATFYVQLNSLPPANEASEGTVSVLIVSSESSSVTPAETGAFQEFEMKWKLFMYWIHQHVTYFFLAWSIGVVLFSLRFFTGLYYLRSIKRGGISLPETWRSRLGLLKRKLGLDKEIQLIASDKVSAPLTFGWLKPVIVFPLSMITLLPEEQLESILLHELAHIRRNDYLINLLHSIIEITFFFNPGYWYISKVLERERELICDDVVVAHSLNPHTYARALTNLAEFSNMRNNRLALHIAKKDNSLLFRIKRIIHPSKSDIMEKSIKGRSYKLASLIIAAAILFFLTVDVNGNSGKINYKAQEQALSAEAESSLKIEGIVINKHGGAGIPGVAVRIKHSKAGTVTDQEGNYSIIAKAQDTLVFSFIGFNTKSLAVNRQRYIPVVLESTEQVEKKGIVVNSIQVKETPVDQPEVTFSISKSGDKDKDSRIFLVPENESLKSFYDYVSNAEIKDIQHANAREITIAEYESMDQSSIVSRLTISSQSNDANKRSVTIARLKTSGNQAEKAPKATAKPQPLFILLKEDILSATSLSTEDYINALEQGSKIDDIKKIMPEQIATMHVWKNKEPLAAFGEAGKYGVIFISLKAPEAEQATGAAVAEESFQVFPNPSGSQVKVSFNNATKQHVRVDVLDPNGTKIHTIVDGPLEEGTHQYEWNAANQQAGVYIIRIQTGENVRTQRLILKQQ